MIRKDDRGLYSADSLNSLAWVYHGFGTRTRVRVEPPWGLTTLRQVHSNVAVIAAAPENRVRQGDALITATPYLLVGVRTADCVPILLVEEKRRVVAAVHAGWRGTADNVVGQTVARMTEAFGAEPALVRAAIGPAIGGCCYEVGPEVADRLRDLFPERDDLDRRTKLDLPEANRRLLCRAGVPDDRIETGAPCCFCTPGEFHSFRRDPRDPGRMLSFVGITAGD